MELTNVPKEFSSRYLNEGFSGGEKKRLEILQLALQQPQHRRPRRDRLGPRHRRAERRRQRRQHRRQGQRHGHADHHPLPAHPAPGASPSACRSCSTAGSSRRAAPSSSTQLERDGLRLDPRRGRRERLTSDPDRRHRRRPPRVPGPRPRGARLPRQRRDRRRSRAAVIEAMDDSHAPRERERAPRRLPARGRGDRAASRAPARPSRPARLAPRRATRSSRRTRPRRSTSSPTRGAVRQRRRRRRDRRDRDGAPLELRALADAGAARSARELSYVQVDGDGPPRPRRARRAAGDGAREARRRRARLQRRSARSTRSPRSSPGRTPRAPSRSSTARRRCRRCPVDVGAHRRRLLRLDRAQGLRADRVGVLHGRRDAARARCRRSSAAAT